MVPIRIVHLVSARPQFVKVAMVSRAVAEYNGNFRDQKISEQIVHTGQHYDKNLSDIFFQQFGITADVNLSVGSGTHAQQTAGALLKFEGYLLSRKKSVDWVIVYGDTNGTLSGALVAAKLRIPLAHVEAGLRRHSRSVPEEINRIVADHISDHLFAPCNSAVCNLLEEGVTGEITEPGDVMYDAFCRHEISQSDADTVLKKYALTEDTFYLATIHRAANTDEPERLKSIFTALAALKVPVVLPLHPRTRKKSELFSSLERRNWDSRIQFIDPIPYLEMLALELSARLIITDSGGVQREAYWCNKPSVVVDTATSWHELQDCGCSQLADPSQPDQIISAVQDFESRGLHIPHLVNFLGDGSAAQQIVETLANAT